MAITSFDPGLVAAAKQYASMVRTATRLAAASSWTSVIDLAGSPGAGVLAGTSTTVGVVPVAGQTGFPSINAFGGGAIGYLAQMDFGSSVAGRIKLFDLLWKGGAYAFNAAVTGQTPTSFSSRVPGGTDFTDTQLWYEQVTASTGVPSANVTYTNQTGTAGKTTGVTAMPAAMAIGRCQQLPLAAGDSGLQGVTGVAATVATVGTFNLLVVRPIWSGRVRLVNDGGVHGPLETGMPIIYPTSALMMLINPDGTSTGNPELEFIIANG